MGDIELLRPGQESLTWVMESQVMSQPLEATIVSSGAITGLGGVSSVPKGLEAKLHLLINNADSSQLALWEDRLDNSATNSLDDWCMVKKKKKNLKN